MEPTKKIKVKFNDFDKNGLRKNGDILPLTGGVCIPKKNFKGMPTLYICEPVEENLIKGIALLFKKVKDRKEFLKKYN